MRVLGVDPSLTAYGWAIHDTSYPVGDPRRCPARGRFQTPAKQLFVTRYMDMRESLRALIREHHPDRMGLEYPIFSSLYSEGMYGLFLYTCEALHAEKQDVVFWSPMQSKAHARESLKRPPKWVMAKADMVEAAKADAAGGAWNHNEADAYLAARLAGRFWLLLGGYITQADLTPVEMKYFTEIHKFTKGKKAGQEVKRGVLYREDERFFRWSVEEEDDVSRKEQGSGGG